MHLTPRLNPQVFYNERGEASFVVICVDRVYSTSHFAYHQADGNTNTELVTPLRKDAQMGIVRQEAEFGVPVPMMDEDRPDNGEEEDTLWLSIVTPPASPVIRHE